jgi:hypothetical protein
LIIVGGAKAWIAMVEGILERLVQRRGTNVVEARHGHPVQRIRCFLFTRLATISLTALSTNAVEIGSPRRRRAP